jgi:hypothetical protein
MTINIEWTNSSEKELNKHLKCLRNNSPLYMMIYIYRKKTKQTKKPKDATENEDIKGR